MPIPAHDDSPGSHEDFINLWVDRTIYREKEGDTLKSTVYLSTARLCTASRPAPVNSPIKYIGNLPFRHPTTYSRNVERYSYTNGTKSYSKKVQNNVHHYTDVGCFINGPQQCSHAMDAPALGVLDTSAWKQAKTEALLKLNEGKVNYAQTILESRKTADLLADRGIFALELFRLCKRKQWKELRDLGYGAFIDGHQLWLEWRYGWRPLAADLYGMFQNAQQALTHPQLLSADRLVRDRYSSKFEYRNQPVRFHTEHLNRTKLWAQVSDPSLVACQNMGMVNPLQLGWEVIPYSFVVDWFVPVGNFLESLSASAGLKFVSGFSSQTRESRYNIQSTVVGECDIERFKFIRQKLSGFPTGKLYAVKSPFRTQRVIDFLTLARGDQINRR